MAASLFGTGGAVYLNTASSLAEEKFIAAAGQLVFNVVTFTYVPNTNSVWVFKNGLKLEVGVDYLESSISSITLLTAASLNDKLDIIGFPFQAITIVDNTIYHTFPFFLASGSQVNIPLDTTGHLPFYKFDGTSSPIPII